MLGIENPKPGDMTNGRGGEDSPLPDGNTLPTSEKSLKSDAEASIPVQRNPVRVVWPANRTHLSVQVVSRRKRRSPQSRMV